MYKLTTGIIGLGIIGIGITGIFTEIAITGDTDGAFVMVFMETMYTNLTIMAFIETIFTTDFITIQTITCQTIEIEDTIDTSIIEMQEITRTTSEAAPTKEVTLTAAASDQKAIIEEMQLPSITACGQTIEIETIKVQEEVIMQTPIGKRILVEDQQQQLNLTIKEDR